MEEQRKKKGIELLPSLHKRVKTRAAHLGIPMWQFTETAFEAMLEKDDATIKSRISPDSKYLEQRLTLILQSLDRTRNQVIELRASTGTQTEDRGLAVVPGRDTETAEAFLNSHEHAPRPAGSSAGIRKRSRKRNQTGGSD
jgi:hypothetical protein